MLNCYLVARAKTANSIFTSVLCLCIYDWMQNVHLEKQSNPAPLPPSSDNNISERVVSDVFTSFVALQCTLQQPAFC